MKLPREAIGDCSQSDGSQSDDSQSDDSQSDDSQSDGSQRKSARWRRTMREAARLAGAALSVGFVLFFFSETMFWGRPDRADFGELLITWFAYSVLAMVFLCVANLFRVAFSLHPAAFFLCAALYGWLCEGVLAATMYDAFPLNIAWTGLAWHALISVGFGWGVLRAALGHSALRTVLMAMLGGAFWGFWAVMWWQPEEGAHVTAPLAWAAHAATQTVLLTASYAMASRCLRADDFTSRRAQVTLCIVCALWFVVVVAPQRPFAALLLLPLLALTILALRRHRARQNFAIATLAPIPLSHLVALAAMPLTAMLVYAAFDLSGRVWATNQLIFWILTPLSALAYVASWISVMRQTARKN